MLHIDSVPRRVPESVVHEIMRSVSVCFGVLFSVLGLNFSFRHHTTAENTGATGTAVCVGR